jgi:hypothetical protein
MACLPLTSMASLASSACCAASSTISICCSLAGCFGCKSTSAAAAKAAYVMIFALAATLAVFLRYWGQAALASWVSVIGICQDSACWGQQADYRISGAVFAFFLIMAALTAMVRVRAPCKP